MVAVPSTARCLALLLALAPVPALAAEYLTELTSDVFQTSGTPRELAQRASTCISQNLKPGTTDSQLIISSDVEGGTVVARSVLSYPDGFLQWQLRSTFTFEAREARFRIVQTNLERFNDRGAGWGGIGKWSGSGWKKAEAVFAEAAAKVAQCVQSGPSKAPW
jgi:hypothetical protein